MTVLPSLAGIASLLWHTVRKLFSPQRNKRGETGVYRYAIPLYPMRTLLCVSNLFSSLRSA